MKQKLALDDLQRFVYLGHVLSETLRLWPPVPTINRITNQDITINQMLIPKHTEIQVIIILRSNK